ncbi:MAG: MarR family transcriptional regulator [Proteobacteria bacterium]|nr:MAG: MarR family transcriptional regulator [Pseudomonadota bacterium]
MKNAGRGPATRSRRKPEPSDDLGPVLDFLQLVWSVEHGFESRSKRMEKALGVTVSQRMVVRLLGRKPKTSAGALATLLRQHPSTLSGILQRLVLRGLVTREDDPNDRRRALFSLTRSGLELDKDKTASFEHAVRRVLRKVPDAKMKLAAEVLVLLASELGS